MRASPNNIIICVDTPQNKTIRDANIVKGDEVGQHQHFFSFSVFFGGNGEMFMLLILGKLYSNANPR